MLLSIVIPAYKTEAYIAECLDSILSTASNDFEVLVVDDGSPDSCSDIVRSYMDADSRVKLCRQPNSGPSIARNNGLHAATGQYIYFMDSDDRMTENGLQSILNSIQNRSSDLLFFEYELIDESGELLGRDPLTSEYPEADAFVKQEQVLRLLADNRLRDYAWRYVAHRSLYLDNGIEFPVNCYFEDLATTYRLVMNAQSILFSQKVILQYRQRRGSIVHGSASTRLRSFEDADVLVTKRAKEIEARYPELAKTCRRGELCFFLWASFDLHCEFRNKMADEFNPLISYVDNLTDKRIKANWRCMKPRDILKFILVKSGLLNVGRH